jgi:biopolymer transport protein ExbD
VKKRRKLEIGPKGGANPDINVTPLVDVVLVLLIIFMVVTPLVERELKVVTPPTEQVDQPQQVPEAQVMLGVKPDGTINVNDEVIAEKDLVDRLKKMMAARSDKTMFFQADDQAPYEIAVTALDDAKAAGAKTIGMVTQNLDAIPAAPGSIVPGAGLPPAPGPVAPGALPK